MKKINIARVPVNKWDSPKGKFAQRYQGISIALGARHCPFDLELCTLPPGTANCPYHFHSAQWEMYVVVSGTGQVRTAKGRTAIRPGDAFICPPREAHQIINNSKRDLRYYVIADNPAVEVCFYPDSNKWMIPGKMMRGAKTRYQIARIKNAHYLDGEE
jgi:uncharacterized cupin superfamily protein